MRAITLINGELGMQQDRVSPSSGEGEVLLNLRLAGICRTDLELVSGYYPYSGVLGHEFVADVVAGSDRLAGKRVVGEINASCFSCEYCRSGSDHHCPQRTVLSIVGRDGCFSDQVLLPEKNLHVVPDHVPDESAVFVEPLAAAFRMWNRFGPSRGKNGWWWETAVWVSWSPGFSHCRGWS